jgi:hypothetical protein
MVLNRQACTVLNIDDIWVKDSGYTVSWYRIQLTATVMVLWEKGWYAANLMAASKNNAC